MKALFLRKMYSNYTEKKESFFFENHLNDKGEMLMSKYYGVKEGHKPGVYTDYEEYKAQWNKYPKAKHKGFETEEEAWAFVNGEVTDENLTVDIDLNDGNLHVFVDGSCVDPSDENSDYSWGYIIYQNNVEIRLAASIGKEKLHSGNVSGELEAAMEVAKYVDSIKETLNGKKVFLYYDFVGIEKFLTGEWTPVKEGPKKYKSFMEEYKKLFTFVDVESHTGVKGNEAVDRLAKRVLGLI